MLLFEHGSKKIYSTPSTTAECPKSKTVITELPDVDSVINWAHYWTNSAAYYRHRREIGVCTIASKDACIIIFPNWSLMLKVEDLMK